MFNALNGFENKTAKQKLFTLLDVAEVILEHDVKINGKTLDDAELADADTEDAFEALRSAMHKMQKQVDTLVD